MARLEVNPSPRRDPAGVPSVADKHDRYWFPLVCELPPYKVHNPMTGITSNRVRSSRIHVHQQALS